MTGRSIAVALTIAVALATSAEPASAAPKSEREAADVRARDLFRKGDKDYAEGRYEEAYNEFHEAYELSPRPPLLFAMSNALERLARYEEAVDALEKYLSSGKVKDKDVVQKRIANLKKRIEEKKAEEEAAEKKRQEEAALAASKNEPPPPPPPPPPPSKPLLPYVLLGGGGLALVGAGVFGALTLSARSDVDAGCRDAAAGRLCTADAESAIDRDRTFGLITDVALVSGVVLGGLGAYFLLTHRDNAPGAVKVGVQATGRGASIVGAF